MGMLLATIGLASGILLMPITSSMAKPVPLNFEELKPLGDSLIFVQAGVVGTASSLIKAYSDQENFRVLRLGGQKPTHQSLLPRPVLRQATAVSSDGTTAASANESSSVTTLATPAPIARLVGHYRSAEMVVFVQPGVIDQQLQLCPTADYSPRCYRVLTERQGGPDWELPSQTVVAKRGYQLEGFDYSGPECGAFTLRAEAVPADKDGTMHVRYYLGRAQTWNPAQDADCVMTLFEVPKTPAAP